MESAIKFYMEIEEEEEKYRLVNGLFIVKYLDIQISTFVGYFHKAGSVYNPTKSNKVEKVSVNQKYNKLLNICTNARGDAWRKLDIAFEEKPIKEILK